MNQHVILTAVGTDRPGIVDEVSEFVFSHGGNIEDSRMVNLRGEFAIMMLIGGDAGALARIRDNIGDLSQKSRLHAEVRDAQQTTSARPPAAGAITYCLTATAMDQAGLVHRFARLMREMNINIESMETHLSPAPVTGSPMFEMEIILSTSHETPLSKLRERLSQLCDELNVDWELSAV